MAPWGGKTKRATFNVLLTNTCPIDDILSYLFLLYIELMRNVRNDPVTEALLHCANIFPYK